MRTVSLMIALFFCQFAVAQPPLELKPPCRDGKCVTPIQSLILAPPVVHALPAARVGNGSLVSRSCPGGLCPVPTRQTYQPKVVRRSWLYWR